MPRKRKPGRPKGSKNKKKRKSYKKRYDRYDRDDDYDEDEFAPLLSSETKRGIAIIFLFTLGALSILSLLNTAGILGLYIRTAILYLFGGASWLFPILMLVSAYLLLVQRRQAIGFVNYFGLLLFTLSFNGLLHLRIPVEQAGEIIATGRGGGYLGLFLSWPLQRIMGFWAALIVLLALLLIAILITFNTSLRSLADKSWIFNSLFEKFKTIFQRKEEEKKYPQETEDYSEDETESEVGGFITKKVKEKSQPVQTKKYKKIDIPLDLLAEQTDKPTAGDIKMQQERIRKTLENFGIEVEMGEVSIGPTVTQYTLKPAEGVKLSQITTLHNDLALALASHPIRIEAPIPNTHLVGIEVPNQTIAIVGLREVLSAKEFATRRSNLALALGEDVSGKPWVINLNPLPHLLIAGATGSGKTVCINSVITSLLFQNSPNTLRFILIDPKRVELPVYNGIPHLLTPVITDVKKTINALKWTISEMDRRFELLSKTGHRDIHSFNRASKEKMPFLVLIIDELADLMASSASEVESYIIRLAQMARATGIHLILATQRPSVDVITGLIKANITARVAFAVASATDSRTILDHAGADKLLGRGDMLYVSASISKPKRLQGAFVSDDEIRRIVEYIKGQNGEPEYDESIIEKQPALISGLSYDEDGDELLEEAKAMVIQTGKASASYLQRRFKIGYARAARILDLLEEQGVVGPADGSKRREILVSEMEEDDYSEPESEVESDSEEAEEPIEFEDAAEEENEQDDLVEEEPDEAGEDDIEEIEREEEERKKINEQELI